MSKQLLNINNLSASVDGKMILKGIDLEIGQGETHVLMGPNGAGKSTLANVLMGDNRYQTETGSVFFEGEDITDARTDERAKKGLFLSFQAPEEIPGLTVESFLRSAKKAYTGQDTKIISFRRELQQKMQNLGMVPEYAERYLNVGFSGGEKKKNEILQLSLLNPKLAILDETDSGLDVDAVKVISENLSLYKNENNAVLIITHVTKILEKIHVDYVHIIADGKIVKTGDASLIDRINKEGYTELLKK
ncbi:MAG TPA: Fe-S cluster assembly ATPase SufC [Candidatus Avacidaminococcus intestinavium]|uniref:Fe-S cluster assembly ATPase SufC n=1 Tax=Candidatus Avacidaminococcus intestinavium TaxID=2840684 RepID=A0A9D1MRN0_9FIRM|nr:Fe-S cluster assembly ATPase SufC [Candidatus Avacidaminococcus intestinavium]